MPPQQRRPAEEGPTLGEIGRVLEALREDTSRQLTDIRRKLEGLDSKYVRLDLYQESQKARDIYQAGLDKRISDLESNQQWIVRLVGGGVITALLGGLFAASKLIGA